MAIFDQRNQRVNYQFNIAGTVDLTAVENWASFVTQLENIQSEFEKATQAGAIGEDIANDAEYRLRKAIIAAKRPEPEEKTIRDHLNEAKALIEGVTAASGLVTALAQAVQLVQKML